EGVPGEIPSERVRRSDVSPQGVTEHTSVLVRDLWRGVERGARGNGRPGWSAGDRAPRQRVDRPDGGDLPRGLPRGRGRGEGGVVEEDHGVFGVNVVGGYSGEVGRG